MKKEQSQAETVGYINVLGRQSKDSRLLTQDASLQAVPMVWNGIHLLSPMWAESRLPWRQLGTIIPPAHLEVLECVSELKQMGFASPDICLM